MPITNNPPLLFVKGGFTIIFNRIIGQNVKKKLKIQLTL